MFGAIHQAFKRGMELTSRLAPPDRALEFHRAVYSAIHPRKPEEARRQMAERLNDAKALLLQAFRALARRSRGIGGRYIFGWGPASESGVTI